MDKCIELRHTSISFRVQNSKYVSTQVYLFQSGSKFQVYIFTSISLSEWFKIPESGSFDNTNIKTLYHSYQDCPIDFHIWHSVPFHDHEIVPPTISWPVRYASVLSHNTHESYVCRAKCRVCGTVKSELGQWIRINIGRTRLKRNLDLISVFHCHCPRAQLLAAHTAAHQS